MRKTLDGLRRAIAEMADAGATLGEISSTLEDTAGLDADRRASLWLYARSCTSDDTRRRAEEAAAGGGRVHASWRPSEPGARGKGERHRMPYVRCPNCGLTSYAARNRWRAGECPGCGEPLQVDRLLPDAPVPGRGVERAAGSGVDDALALAREQLEMDVALLTEVDEGREVVRASAGEWPSLGPLDGLSIPFEETFCKRLLEGLISNVVADAAGDERVRDLELARQLGVGSWIGVPLTLPDARAYMLCCLASEARPALGEEEVRFLSGLGESVRAELEASIPG